MNELAFANATTFARRLSVANRETAVEKANNRLGEVELTWNASGLITSWLEAGRVLHTGLGPDDLARLLSHIDGHEAVVARLRDRGALRTVLGRVELPYQLRYGKAEGLDPAERQVVQIIQAGLLDDEQTVWIEHDQAVEIHNRHIRAHPRTPSLAELCSAGALRRCENTVNGFDIIPHLQQGPWHEVTARAAAALWTTGYQAVPDRHEFLLGWLAIGVARDVAWLAPRYLERSALVAFLDAATEAILGESDLLGWPEEGNRLQWEVDSRAHFRWIPESSDFGQSLVTLSERLEEFDHAHRGMPLHDGARHRIDSLVAAVVRYDTFDEGYERRWSRIRKLLLGGRSRPHLLRALPRFIAFARADAIGGMLPFGETAAWGLRLLDSLELDTHWMDDAITRIRRVEEQRTVFWIEGTRIALSSAAVDRRQLAECIDELLTPVVRKATSRDFFHPETSAISTSMAEQRLALMEAEVIKAARDDSNSIGPLLFERWRDRCQNPPRPGFPSFPKEELRLLGWLLSWSPLHRDPSASHPLAPQIAAVVSETYMRELVRESETGGHVVWLDDQPEILQLDWSRIAQQLHSEHLESLFRPLDFGNALQRAHESDDNTALAVESWINRVRLHLRILLKIHSGLVEWAPKTPRLKSIEEAICDLLLLRDPRDPSTTLPLMLVHSLAYRGADVAALASDMQGSLATLEDTDQLLKRWVEATTDLAALLAFAAKLDIPPATQLVKVKLKGANLQAYLSRQIWFPRIEAMAYDAASLNLNDIAKDILAFGDEQTREHRYSDKWARSAYKTRLLIAYNERDAAAIDNLRIPDSDDDDGQPLANKDFYRALVLVDADPAAAATAFRGLCRNNPSDTASHLNAIAAEIRTLADVDPDNRQPKVAALLEELQGLLSLTPDDAGRRYRQYISYLVLDAMDVANLHTRFDAEWATLPVHLQLQSSFATLHARNQRRRGRTNLWTQVVTSSTPVNFFPTTTWPTFNWPESSILSAANIYAQRNIWSTTAPSRPRGLINPFSPGQPLDTGVSPPGRDDIVVEMLHLLAHRRPIALIGQRRSGKTTILNHVGRRLADAGTVHFVSLQGREPIRTRDDLAVILARDRSLGERTGLADRMLSDPDRRRHTYLVDELAYLTEADGSVFPWLRSLGQESGGLVLSGSPWDWARLIDRASKVSVGSSFGNDITPIELGPLAERDAVEFFVTTAAEPEFITHEVAQQVVDLCGGWPFYLHVMGDGLFRTAAPISSVDIRHIYDSRLLGTFGASFRGRWSELPNAIVSLILGSTDHVLPRFHDLKPIEKSLLLDTGLCTIRGDWLEDRPFFDWIWTYAAYVHRG